MSDTLTNETLTTDAEIQCAALNFYISHLTGQFAAINQKSFRFPSGREATNAEIDRVGKTLAHARQLWRSLYDTRCATKPGSQDPMPEWAWFKKNEMRLPLMPLDGLVHEVWQAALISIPADQRSNGDSWTKGYAAGYEAGATCSAAASTLGSCDNFEFEHDGETHTVSGNRAAIKALLKWREQLRDVADNALRVVHTTMQAAQVRERDPSDLEFNCWIIKTDSKGFKRGSWAWLKVFYDVIRGKA